MTEDNTSENEVNHRFEVLKHKYGERLSAEEMEAVRDDVKSLVQAAEELRSVKLRDSDEPISLFVPYRKEG